MYYFVHLTERFYHTAHPAGPKSSIARSGATKCPFRAALQSKTLHTSSTAAVPPAVETSSKGEVKETEKMETSEAHQCKCVVDGLTPKGVLFSVNVISY